MASSSVNGFKGGKQQGFAHLQEAQKYLEAEGFSDYLVYDFSSSDTDGRAPISQEPGYYAVASGRRKGIYLA